MLRCIESFGQLRRYNITNKSLIVYIKLMMISVLG